MAYKIFMVNILILVLTGNRAGAGAKNYNCQ